MVRKAKLKLLLLACFCSLFTILAHAQTKDAVDINANVMEMQDDKKLIVFTGDVVAKKQDMTLYCSKLEVYYKEDETSKKKDVDYMIAQDNVKIIQLDKVAVGNLAKYFRKNDTIILEGKPAIVKEADGNEVRGDKITFYLKENRSLVEGNRPKVIFRIGE